MAQVLPEKCFHDFKSEAAKWTHEDEICKLSDQIETSRDLHVVNFKNFKEDWEDDKINTKNKAHESLLNGKYQHIFPHDEEEDEIRRAIHVEWSTTRPAKYVVITQLVHQDAEANNQQR